MTNKPMLSVERELLERVADNRYRDKERISIARHEALWELRALLDKPAAQHQGDKVSIERIDIQMLKGGTFRFSSEPEGLLVFYRDHAELVEALSLEVARLNRVKFALAEKAAAHADNCAVYRIQLAEQPAPVAKSRCEQVPFSMLCYGAKFKYTPGESAVFVKIGPDLVAGWDGQKVADGWIGQPVCSFSDDGNLLAAVTLVHERPAPVAEVPEGYCIMPRRLTAENGAKALLLGEFKLRVTKECPECCELEEPTEGCSMCDGEGEYEQRHTIPWDQIKFIYSQAVAGLARINKPL